MHRYRCPSCKGRLQLRRIYDQRYIISCDRCRLGSIVRPMKSGDDEAYMKFLELYDLGSIQRETDIRQLLEEEGLLRSEREVLRMVERSGVSYKDLPEAVRSAVMSRDDYLVLFRRIEEQSPSEGASVDDLPVLPELVQALKEAGIERLYRFQQEAVERILSGEDVVIAAPTGSGKTEAFAIPIVQIASDEARGFGPLKSGRSVVNSLIVYPTKALARDQLPKLRRLAHPLGVRIEVFDGDTSKSDRARIIEDPPDIIITNFDTIHHHLLHRTYFSRLLRTVQNLVVDEVHVYIGTFGANVHFITRRLQRLSGRIRIVAASATISNPKAFCESLFARPFSVVEGGEGRHGEIYFTAIFPTLRTHRALVIDLLRKLTSSGYKTLSFSNSHLGAELTAFYAKRSGVDIQVHRAGLLPSHRSRVEERFKEGSLKAVASTPTLELGIDIGLVDSIISGLVPISRLIQRTGRAGRRGQKSIVFLCMRENDPISQYYRLNPEDYFKDIEPGYVDPSNPVVAEYQILAAAMDRAIRRGEFNDMKDVLTKLVEKRYLVERDDRLYPDYRRASEALRSYDIRGSGESVTIRMKGRKVGERGMPQAMEELHPGAVYFQGGARFRSISFNFERGVGEAIIESLPLNYPYYTRALREEWPTIMEVYERKKVLGIFVEYCELSIKKKVVGYVNIEMGVDVARGKKVYLDRPVEYEFRTKGIVFRAPYPSRTVESYPEERFDEIAASGYHAAEHVIIEGTNMITGGSASDMGGVALGSSGLIFVYDGSLGGNGASRLLYERFEEALKRGSKILEECTCTSESGCPRCTYSYHCGNNNEYLHRGSGIEIFRRILAGEEVMVVQPIEGEKTIV